MPKKNREALVRIALTGAEGRMGQLIRALSKPGSGYKVTAAVNEPADWAKVSTAEVDVVVDFSSPAGIDQALDWCLDHNKRLVSGTTGISNPVFSKLKKGAAKIPILYSANMSLGMAVLLSMLNCLKGLKDFDFQIEEAHHSKKKDRPSGTALLLQEKLVQVTGRKLPLPNSIRGGGIPGIHQIWAMGPEETLVLQHMTFNRAVFARGALNAARWLIDKKEPGLYDLTDLYKT